jgi:DNA (cytosine-5)-methyltransferase 1
VAAEGERRCGVRYGSVCSGIEAATVAWQPLGWQAAFFAEIDPFPSAVLAYRWPETRNLGDFTAIEDGAGPIDLLVGGTPCQSFSVAGKRLGLDDPRGNLAIEFLRLARRLRPRWLVWENVPGVLSSGRGRDFGAFLGFLVELGYGWAYRVLDAQYFGVPQRRRRVFVVGHLGDWRRAIAVLFERESLSGNPPPSREAGTRVAPCLEAGANGTGGPRPPGSTVDTAESLIPDVAFAVKTQARRIGQGWNDTMVCHAFRDSGSSTWGKGVGTLSAHDSKDGYCSGLVTHTLRADGFDASEDGTGRGTPIIPIDMRQASRGGRMTNNRREGTSGGAPGTGIGEAGDPSPTIASSHTPAVASSLSAVRRLTPRECERLQGFPDDFTLVPYRGKPAQDGPRYKALGNSMAVPVVRWLGRRILEAS